MLYCVSEALVLAMVLVSGAITESCDAETIFPFADDGEAQSGINIGTIENRESVMQCTSFLA